ncbi:D-lactate dehydrogenase (cytochrome) [Cryptococcus neoformans C23]|uniref:D-lactate dehydrogenase (cytochrome) n=2 Tax=Cryptococcus neoformans TaxID=5207 RepID=A0A854Q5S6_CRYNE|nr:D-lactate dehydrogenase (cytochrome) [Cryptococcus neoformans var. grubii H99]AUB27742.1 D-lactate dehydrogenase (cytochrome) [Cryptococcus neoformans var. grubii]OWZ27454.1 D-lactate dehydrogenase (cytochrome) [Cryptococcus neoformans var. grubii AD2-60a]OWZ32965.1 D-lactate dehydrogenase (cytochrome) [Cryptococcus neoformans var. grubii AD1-83a]OWZ39758.1 D-lactate dehydrogenase (cytochrome) [Cryptococcus neoformans var. grubii C23]OWZ50836.1 D-lactate dehydrogenase (cytochrome) [Cryptoco|eukprot:XP_012052552.1 D-lactate dehydrogenase (cytochrome) [Cryptococcus neoformans var. grubii H99]
MSAARPLNALRRSIQRSFRPRSVPRRFNSTVPPPLPPPPPAGISSAWYALSLALFCGAGYLVGNVNSLPPSTALQESSVGIAHQKAQQPSYGSHKDYVAAINDLKASWGKKGKGDKVSIDDADLETHGVSDWSYHPAKKPTVVVWVDTTEEVQEVVKLANKYKVPITPFSGGTSLEGHFSSPYGGISLDVSAMDKILEVSELDGEARVQAGVKWEDLNAYLKEKGVPLFFPLDPGPGATIGGMAGTGCSGTNAVRYGTAKAEWFLNLTVVLPTGEIIKTRSHARKSAAGWDATKLFIGAEGTLGIVTEATLRLAPLLPTKCAVVTFDGVEEAVRAATEVVNAGYPVQCVEYMDARTMEAINKGGLAGRQYKPVDSLFFKFQGSDHSMAEVSQGVKALVAKHGGKNFEFSASDAEADALWQGRKTALWSVLGLLEDSKVWTTDVCVPISKLPTLVRETSEDFEKRGLVACHFGHVGDGNVHSLALFRDEAELHRVEVAVHEMVERAIRLGGTCSGEHGVGLGKIDYLPLELGNGTVNLMETIKRTVDPFNLMNPGKVYPNIKPKQQ